MYRIMMSVARRPIFVGMVEIIPSETLVNKGHPIYFSLLMNPGATDRYGI